MRGSDRWSPLDALRTIAEADGADTSNPAARYFRASVRVTAWNRKILQNELRAEGWRSPAGVGWQVGDHWDRTPRSGPRTSWAIRGCAPWCRGRPLPLPRRPLWACGSPRTPRRPGRFVRALQSATLPACAPGAAATRGGAATGGSWRSPGHTGTGPATRPRARKIASVRGRNRRRTRGSPGVDAAGPPAATPGRSACVVADAPVVHRLRPRVAGGRSPPPAQHGARLGRMAGSSMGVRAIARKHERSRLTFSRRVVI